MLYPKDFSALALERLHANHNAKDLSPTGERLDGRNGIIVNENGRVPEAEKWYKYYEAVFYAFYNRELEIDDSNMSGALEDCGKLLDISIYLGCTALISKPIEVALVKQGQDLFRSIQTKPYLWVGMASNIQSELIFKECMVHLVGNWKMLRANPDAVAYLRDNAGVRATIEKHHRQLVLQCKNFEHAIMSIYPGNMQAPSEDFPIKRDAYAKDIFVWMALSFFRHWVGQRLLMDKGRHAADCGYSLYKSIGLGGEAYMDRAVLQQFHAKFPMTKKAMTVIENHLEEIKEIMKGIADKHNILKAHCQLDVHRFPVDYLTCTDFRREDLPWLKQDTTPRHMPARRQYKPGGNDIARQNLETSKRRHGRGPKADGEGEDYGLDDEDLRPSPSKRARFGTEESDELPSP